jgi:hypothetical protein
VIELSPEQERFIEFSRQLRELGATHVHGDGYSAEFSPPVRVVATTLPKPEQHERPGDDATPEERKSWRSHVGKVLSNG